jgi:hypothetical protein
MPLTKEHREAVAGADLLDIVVPYTTPQLTRLALKKAEELASEIPSRIRILRMQRVPFPLDLRHPPVSLAILREQTRRVARGICTAEIMIYLTRDAEETLLKTLQPDSVLVIASHKRWWRTVEERLKRLCVRHGHQAMVYSHQHQNGDGL